ncbi:MAG: heterodisulfide reductase [Dethiobacter sp.]|nr:MAG: heterodisulfide reductase [Dethiobacter sp.]
MKVSTEQLRSYILKDIAVISGENVVECYQCGKCTAACPVSKAMDILPHQVVRFLQLGMLDEVMESNTIWICASCFTCAGRCPRDVDVANIMEALRVILLRKRGVSRLKTEDVRLVFSEGMPEQGVVSAFRKFAR